MFLYYTATTRRSDLQPPILKSGGIEHLLGLQDGRFTTSNTYGPDKYPTTSYEPVSFGTNTCLLTHEQVPINDAYPHEKMSKSHVFPYRLQEKKEIPVAETTRLPLTRHAKARYPPDTGMIRSPNTEAAHLSLLEEQ